MRNQKLWLACVDGESRPSRPSMDSKTVDDSLQDIVTPAEGLRLIRAFLRVPDPAIRKLLITIAEKHARK
jgi:hypothetical protein